MIDRTQKRFLAALSALMAKIAMADGVIDPLEIVSVRFIWSRLGLTAEQSEFCQKSFDLACNDSVSLERYAHEYVETKYGDSTRALLYELLWELACSDGVLHRLEAAALKKLESALLVCNGSYRIYYSKYVSFGKGVVDEEKESLKRQSEKREREERQRKEREYQQREAERLRAEAEKREREKRQRQDNERARERERRQREEERRRAEMRSPIVHAYSILGCSSSDSDDVIRCSYRILAMKNHPDVLERDGVSAELIARATKKMAEINEAWNIICKHRKSDKERRDDRLRKSSNNEQSV